MTKKKPVPINDDNIYEISFTCDTPTEPDIRDKGQKTDQELLDEYFSTKTYCDQRTLEGFHSIGTMSWCVKCSNWTTRMKAIESELGKEKILAERVRRLEERVSREIATQHGKNGVLVSAFLVSIALSLLALIFSIFS